MSKTITIRVSDEDYKQLAAIAKAVRRPISNFILHATMNAIADKPLCSEQELKELWKNEELMKQLWQNDKIINEGK